jgi:hypothetical protein
VLEVYKRKMIAPIPPKMRNEIGPACGNLIFPIADARLTKVTIANIAKPTNPNGCSATIESDVILLPKN